MVKGTVHTTYVARYKHGNITITRHFKESHELHKYLSDIWQQASDIQVEKLVTTRTPMPKLVQRLYQGNV